MEEEKKENKEEVEEIKESEKKEENEEVSSEKEDSKEVEKHNKLLKSVIVVIAGFFVLFLVIYFINGAMKTFEYRGMTGNVVKFCDSYPCLVTYQTSIPVMYEGEVRDYNFYLRNNPEDLDEIPFTGEINLDTLIKKMVLNGTEFDCDGDQVIALQNVVTLYKVLGIETITDENATCDEQGRYIFLQIEEGEETKVEQFGPACYRISVADCEILKGTERFMTETFVEVNKRL